MKIYGDRYNKNNEVEDIVEIIQNCLTFKKPITFSLEANWGKGKTWILIIAVLFGVLLGTLLGETISVVNLIRTGELAGWTYADIPYLFALLFMDGTYVASVAKNILVGLVFAGLGIFSLVRRANKEVSDIKVQDLK